jgi:hypothetical protein
VSLNQASTFEFALYLIGSLLMGIALSQSARKQGRWGWPWLLSCLILSPVITYIAFRIIVKHKDSEVPPSASP